MAQQGKILFSGVKVCRSKLALTGNAHIRVCIWVIAKGVFIFEIQE